ncbi:amidohydrolase [Bordetella sp. BOR01]|uniref:amidohydrolase family protein n=1 Tax=Bordetella sp. BOR01 TaxID=2854779 RepID=UPI001C439693|nr:amidohydrolase family protein [Bordetella sp. BOR01]MBV7483372.1 amidohydrolase family protein [Bordetella sp. BOR01]
MTGRPVTGIDAHAHVMSVSARLVGERHSAPRRDVTAREYIGLLDANGLSHGVLTAPSFLGTDNSLLLQALDAFPGRLAGTAIVDPAIDEASLSDMRSRGMAGIRLNWTRRASLPDVDSAEYTGLFQKLGKLGMHVELFVEDAHGAAIIPRLLDHGVVVVIDHFGAPDPVQGVKGPGFAQVLRAVASGRAWVKLSAPYRLGSVDPRRYVDALLQAGGPGQLMWGSDFPWISHEDYLGGPTFAGCLQWLADWVPDEAAHKVILCDTPARVFGFAHPVLPD